MLLTNGHDTWTNAVVACEALNEINATLKQTLWLLHTCIWVRYMYSMRVGYGTINEYDSMRTVLYIDCCQCVHSFQLAREEFSCLLNVHVYFMFLKVSGRIFALCCPLPTPERRSSVSAVMLFQVSFTTSLGFREVQNRCSQSLKSLKLPLNEHCSWEYVPHKNIGKINEQYSVHLSKYGSFLNQ